MKTAAVCSEMITVDFIYEVQSNIQFQENKLQCKIS